MHVTIYHNPRCSKSRQTLQLLQDRKADISIVEYLKTPPSAQILREILDALHMQPRDLMRKNESPYKLENLGKPELTDDELIAKMIEHPILIERPIVRTNDRTVIGRPPERVLEII